MNETLKDEMPAMASVIGASTAQEDHKTNSIAYESPSPYNNQSLMQTSLFIDPAIDTSTAVFQLQNRSALNHYLGSGSINDIN
jgi:hypothetical protein